MMLLKVKVKQSLDYIQSQISVVPKTGIVLGSGLGGIADSLKKPVIINTANIPHYPLSTVPGHAGRWVFGEIKNVPVLAIQGRVHYYEGYTLQQVTYPVHLVASLGIKNLILTTSSGGLCPRFTPGDLMIITDHINFGFGNPLIGKPDNILGKRFPDMSLPYDPRLIKIAEKAGADKNTPFQKGVFCWMSGPAYETSAEVRMLRFFGADAVSMSTVPEVIVAVQRRLSVLGISMITNFATGITPSTLSHNEVISMANVAGKKLEGLFKIIIPQI
jgi:purine-nucleoside phosphorylase